MFDKGGELIRINRKGLNIKTCGTIDMFFRLLYGREAGYLSSIGKELAEEISHLKEFIGLYNRKLRLLRDFALELESKNGSAAKKAFDKMKSCFLSVDKLERIVNVRDLKEDEKVIAELDNIKRSNRPEGVSIEEIKQALVKLLQMRRKINALVKEEMLWFEKYPSFKPGFKKTDIGLLLKVVEEERKLLFEQGFSGGSERAILHDIYAKIMSLKERPSGGAIKVVIVTEYYFGMGGGELHLQFFNKLLAEAGFKVHVLLSAKGQTSGTKGSAFILGRRFGFHMTNSYNLCQVGDAKACEEYKNWGRSVREEFEEMFGEHMAEINAIFQRIKPDVVLVCGITPQPSYVMAMLKRYGPYLGYYHNFEIICTAHVMLAEKNVSTLQDVQARLWISRMFGVLDPSLRNSASFIGKYLPHYPAAQLRKPMDLVKGWMAESYYMKHRLLLADQSKFTAPGAGIKRSRLKVCYNFIDPRVFRPLGTTPEKSK